MSFTQKLLRVTFNLATGNFQGGGNNATYVGMRINAHIVKAGGTGIGTASVAVYGMTLDHMNQLTTYGLNATSVGKNTITIEAGEGDGNGNPSGTMTQVFQGTIQYAWMDGQAQPRVPFRAEAFAGGFERVMPIPATSYQGSMDVATALQKIAQQAGLKFENNAVNVKLDNHYAPGAAGTQIKEIAVAAGIEWIIDNGTLAIWPAGQPRKTGGGAAQITLSKTLGMIGYPSFNSKGLLVKAEFRPGLEYGSQITVQSDITPACGDWIVYAMEYDLDSYTPHGKWQLDMAAAKPGNVPVAP